jgi:hypothetical protein
VRRFLALTLPLAFAALYACSSDAPIGPVADAGPADAAAEGASNPDSGLCVAGQSVDGVYPKAAPGYAVGTTVPDLDFEGLAEDGTPKKLALHDYFEPCAATARLLVVRVGAGFCGTCRWHLQKDLFEKLDIADRVTTLDLLLSNDDNSPASRT